MTVQRSGRATELPRGLLVGSAQNREAATGCTAILCFAGATGGVAVRGGAPATRETDLLAPENTVERVHAVVLSGGSAFGLDAASGVVQYLEEQRVGFEYGGAVVPLVVGASLFDLDVGSALVRPDLEMGYAAAASAEHVLRKTGNVGAGTGASVGRFLGPGAAMKGGLGAASVRSEGLVVTALVAVNCLGNVFDRARGAYVAGALETREGGLRALVEPLEVLPLLLGAEQEGATNARTNTCIGVVLTNAHLRKAEVHRVASMAHDGLARSIYPAHTSFDGDALFALATGEIHAHRDVVGALAALAVEEAALDAVHSAAAAYGLPSASSLNDSSSCESYPLGEPSSQGASSPL